jgi:hypothetical protein
MYFDDGSVAQACPPLKALLHIMACEEFEGKDLESPEVRGLFRRETLLTSDWYQARLKERQNIERSLWNRHIRYLEQFLKRKSHADEAERLGIEARLTQAVKMSRDVDSDDYLKELRGTIGTQPISQFARPVA